jgi:cation diffusion facilitator family transporter
VPESLSTVFVAFAANLVVAVAKTAAAFVSGSPSMVAEATHSWADTGNEVLLLMAERRAAQPKDASHPLGYGREAYVWSMFAAFGLFMVGAVVSVMHGVAELRDPEEGGGFGLAYGVLAVSFVLEGFSFGKALRQLRADADDLNREMLDHVLRTSDPMLRAVVFEDGAALVGLAIAFVGISARQVTGSPLPDAIGSILVGTMLGVIAFVLIDRNHRFLVGQVVDEAIRDTVLGVLLDQESIERVTSLHVEIVGPRRLLVVAAVDLCGDDPEHEVAEVLRRLERDLQARPRIERAILTLAARSEPSLTRR